ncbi:MAG: hypothetical protein HYY55_02745 [Candidatus Niyogibacteria bacterium]|nr:MAG: hypothetical protein HYY55_02745 [Candidatus Niyogibacteria bacterium]
MDAPLFGVLKTTFRIVFYSEPWFEWLVPILTTLVMLYWLFIILHRTHASRNFKVSMAILSLPISFMLLNIPNFYKYMNAGAPDKNCPEININPLTKEIEPIKYDYLAQHVVPGPVESGFADLFLKQHEIFGQSLNVQNSHVCRLPYDERTRMLLQNLQEAKRLQGEAAKRAGVPVESASEFGNIRITLPGSAESRAKMDSALRKKGDKEQKGERDRDESFGRAEFKAPKTNLVPKTETGR